MGVFATFCQLCGLPVQHNCYVPHEGMYLIYRGPGSVAPGDPLPGFSFGPEHEWLRQALGLRFDPSEEPQVLRGEVQDGHLAPPHASGEESCFVGEGDDERAALHERCWELAGRPEYAALAGATELPAWKELLEYQQQLFEFEEFAAAGLAWALVDPALPEGAQSLERIHGILAGLSPEPPPPNSSRSGP